MKITPINNTKNNTSLHNATFKGHYDIEPFNPALKERSELYHCTSFFRDFIHNEMIVNHINKHFKNNDKIKILSAGCSTGEEAVTMSMLLDNLKDKVEILGIDISQDAVNSAKSGKFKMDYLVNGAELEDNFLFVDTGRELTETQKKLRTLFNKFLEPTQEKSINNFQPGYEPFSYFNTKIFKLREGMAKNCKFIQGDIREIPTLTKGEKFDVVLCRNTIYHLFPKIPHFLNTKLLKAERPKIEGIYNSILPQLTKSVKDNGILCFGEDEFYQLHFFEYMVNFVEKCGFIRLRKQAIYEGKMSNLFVKTSAFKQIVNNFSKFL